MNETSFTLDLGDPMRAGVFFVTSDDIAILDDIVGDAGLLARHVELRGCADKATLLARMAGALDIPDDRGRNWDALGDALRDLSWLPAPGYALRGELLYRHADGFFFFFLFEVIDERYAAFANS